MKEGNKFYSVLIPVSQHERLVRFSRKSGVSAAKLVRQGIDLVIEGKGKSSEGCNDGQNKNLK